jgi:hypothetical protein
MVKINSTNNYAPFKFMVSSTISQGTHTTIASALSDAASGDTIYICDGTYTENLTAKNGVNLVSLGSAGTFSTYSTGNVIIVGKISVGSSVSFGIFGCRLQTNSDFCIECTASCSVTLFNCQIAGSNNTTLGMSNSSANIILQECSINLSTTGISFISSSGGVLWMHESDIFNSGSSTTATTISDGTLYVKNSTIAAPISTSGTGRFQIYGSNIDTSAINTTSLAMAGNQSSIVYNTLLSSGSAACLSVGTGTTVTMINSSANSSATNVLTGAGTLRYGGIVFDGTSSGHDVTTETALTVLG